MSAPTVQAFHNEDTPSTGLGSKDAVEKFYRLLNTQLAGIAAPLSNGLTQANNMNAQVKTITIQAPATDWTSITAFSGTWVLNSTGVYVRQEGMLTGRMTGNIKGGAVPSTAFTLPAALWPVQTCYFTTPANGAYGGFHIDATGNVIPDGGTWTGGSLECSWVLATPSCPVLSCFPVSVQTTVSQPQGVVLWALFDQTTHIAVAAPGGLHWKNLGIVGGGPTIQILNLPGLTLGHTYQATLLISGG